MAAREAAAVLERVDLDLALAEDELDAPRVEYGVETALEAERQPVARDHPRGALADQVRGRRQRPDVHGRA